MREVLLPLLAGFGAGMLSAWGVGGGTLLLLVMTLVLGVEQRTAQAINLLFFLPAAAAGLLLHRKNGYFHGGVWRETAVGGMAAALLAALAALRWDTEALRRPFGLFLLYAGGPTLWSLFRKKGEERDQQK